MNIAIIIFAALITYLICSINSAIILSKLIYHKDIRNEGSGNAGFTNFKRSFGMKWAWLVFIFDFSKALIFEIIFGLLFQKLFTESSLFFANDAFRFGVAYTAFFGMLGHCYPIWHQFKGGKGFLVCLSTLWILNIYAGVGATLIMVILVLIIKYMSLSTMLAMIIGDISLFFLPWPTKTMIPTICAFSICVIFMIFRHKENIKRLINGTESKFELKKKH